MGEHTWDADSGMGVDIGGYFYLAASSIPDLLSIMLINYSEG
ncbi:hypothetical protein GA0116948_10869 [Chitinophaga costaii]|uniref:Uncharacterized protein n=1 Tax=Chitinophaga costaii TaxID=1335309 RepID=A0A1C4EFE0_9BACT|nr:hypothetical protein GA0116948_10869 [Chitinophaga costaii]